MSMNILFLASWYPNRVIPYNGNFIERHAQAVALKHNVKALHVLSDPNLKDTYEVERRKEKGVDSYIVYYKKVTSKLFLLSSILKLFRYVKAHLIGLKILDIQHFKIDITHLNVQFPAGLIALYLNLIKKIPYVISENHTAFLPSNKSFERSHPIHKSINKLIAKKAAFLLPVSKDLELALKGHGFSNNYKIIPNVVDTNLFQLEEKRDTIDKWKLIHVSHFRDDHKNLSGIIRVIKRLSDTRNDFEFLIVGDGDINKPTELAKSLNVHDYFVKLIGNSSIEEVASYMKTSDAFVLFSNWENLPCVVIEAFSCGMPVIATDVGGTREMLHDFNGLLIQPKDEDALFDGINSILNNYNRFDRKAIREYAVNHFSYEKVGEAFDEVYQLIKDQKNSNV